MSLVGNSALLAWQSQDRRVTTPSPLTVLQLRPNFFMLAGAGGNVGLQTGPDGGVLVDTGSAANADTLVAAIKAVAPAHPLRYVILTNADPDHVGGAAVVSTKAGRALFSAGGGGISADFFGGGAAVLSYETVSNRMVAPTGQPSPYPSAGWPTETFFQPRKYLYLNGEGIEVLHQPAAHSDGDTIVFFRRSDVIVAGDVLDTTQFPVIDTARGGGIDGTIAALNTIVNTAIPSVPISVREEGTLVIPGHGRVCDQLDVVEYRDMVTIIRDRVRDLIKAGRTLEQINAANPTRGYTERYGSNNGSWTTAQFVEATYQSLTKVNP